jgi:hypothetical protein
MINQNRRRFLKLALRTASATVASSAFPPSIRRALALPARGETGTISDLQHVVMLMMENRSFDHYFGSLRGVRGFGDRHPVPVANGKPIWHQGDGEREIVPFHLDSETTSALRVRSTAHSFADAQAAWNHCDSPDHVDAHRSVTLVAGAYVRRHALVSTRYTTVNVIKTIEELLVWMRSDSTILRTTDVGRVRSQRRLLVLQGPGSECFEDDAPPAEEARNS